MSYKVEIYDGTGEYEDCPSLFVTKEDNDVHYGVMRIGKPNSHSHMAFYKDYMVSVWWRKSCHDLTTLSFDMTLPVEQYNTLVAGNKEEVDQKVIKFCLDTVKTLKELESSFPK